MDRRQGTIDQVFRARKRKLNSPVISPLSKSKKYNNDRASEETVGISPSKKGTLEAFLCPVKRADVPGADVLSAPKRGLPELRRAEVKFASTKPWLTPCSLSSRPASTEYISDQNGGEDARSVERRDNAPAPSPLKTQLVSTVPPSSPKTQVVQPNTGAGSNHNNPSEAAQNGAQNVIENSANRKPDGDVLLSQFTHDFLAMCCSGIPSPSAHNLLTGELLSHQQKRKDEPEAPDFPGRKKLCADVIPEYHKLVLQDGQASLPIGRQKTALPDRDLCRSLDFQMCSRKGQVEQQVGVRHSSQDFIMDASLKVNACIDGDKNKHSTNAGALSNPEAVGTIFVGSGDHNLSGGRHHSLAAGSPGEVACDSRIDVSIRGSRTVEVKFDSGNDASGIPVLCTSPEMVLSQSRTAAECSSDDVAKDAPSAGQNICSPLENALPSFPADREATSFTPEPCSEDKPTLNSSQAKSLGGSYYRSSLFSPGDEFWEEAIEIVMASKMDVSQQSTLYKGNHSGTPAGKCSGNGSYGAKSSKVGLQHQGLAANGSALLKQDLQTKTTKLNSVNCNDHQAPSSEDHCPQPQKPGEVSVVDGYVQVKTLKSQNRAFNFSQKTQRAGVGFGGWLKQLGSISPLPVRHFDFSGKKENVDHKSPQKFYHEKNSNLQITSEECRKEAVLSIKNKGEGFASPGVNMAPPKPHLLNPALSPAAVIAESRDSLEATEAITNTTMVSSLQAHAAGAIMSKDTDDLGKAVRVPSQDVGVPTSDISRCSGKERNLEISHWLPKEATAVYAKKGLTQLYPWQLECLLIDGVLDGRNLVYSASTSAGKSLVAELLMIRRVVATGRIALLVLPFVSICSEKAEHLEAVLEPLGKRVRHFFGTQGSASVPKDTAVAVCTIEKANSLINKLLEEGRLSEIGLIVIDELHMVGDRDRGYLLELLLTKIRYASGEFDNIRESSQEKSLTSEPSQTAAKRDSKADLQVIGMSATMPNIGAVAHWLQAAVFETEFRPVPLEEFVKVGPTIYNRNMEICRTVRKGADFAGKDPDHVVELCHEVVREGHSVLVFCATRKACETSAMHIAKYLPSLLALQKEGTKCLKDGAAAVEELRKFPSGLDPVLAQTIPAGVAYHHAGLTVEERDVVEQCFRDGSVRVLTATSTLAAGVNLPARRVIFRQPKIGRDFLDGTRYRQMAGRAGRAGIDTKGESILICKPEEMKKMVTVLSEGCQPLKSCLTDDKIGMMRALLEVVAGGIVQSPQDVNRYVRCTLFNSTESFDQVVKSVQDSLRWLCRRKFVEWSAETKVYSTTPLGRAAFGSSLSPEESLVVFEDLAKAREGFVLASDLHLVYQVTPIYVELEPDWSLFYQKFVELSHLEQAVGSRVGVLEPFLMRMAHGAPLASGSRSKGFSRSPARRSMISPFIPGSVEGKFTNKHQTLDVLRVCRRFYVALMLSKLVQEVPLMEVSDAFRVPRGTVQALQASAGRFAAMVAGFCERLGWHDLEGLVSKFQNRVSFGVKSEIVELTEIPFIKGARARALYKAGFRTIQAVAEATYPELVKALSEASPWAAQDDSRRNNQHRVLMGVVRKIKFGAQRIVLDRAEEARVAAFSAIRALGVDFPSSWPQMPANISVNSVVVVEDDIDEPLSKPPAIEPVTDRDQLQPALDVGQMMSNLPEKDYRTHIEVKTSAGAGLAVAGIVKNADHGVSLEVNDKENFLKTSKVVAELHVKRDGLPGTNIEPVIQKFKKGTGSTSTLNRLFGGVDLLNERSLREDVDGGLDAGVTINYGPIDVDKMKGGFECFFEQWKSIEEFCFDLNYKIPAAESLGQVFEIEGVAICWLNSPVYYVSLSRSVTSDCDKEVGSGSLWEKKISLMDTGSNLSEQGTKCMDEVELMNLIGIRWGKISGVLSGHGSRKVGWNLKNQLQALQFAGASCTGPELDDTRHTTVQCIKQYENRLHQLSPTFLGELYLDVHIAAWLLWPDEESSQNLTLEQEVKKRLPGEVAANASRAGRWTNQMGKVSHNGCCRRVAQVRALHFAFWKLLISEDLHHPLLHIEMPMVKVLVEMESSSIGIDMEACRSIRHVIEDRMKGLEARAHKLAGTPFALSVPADVANILYNHLKLPVPPGCNKGKHHPSTNKQALDFLRHQNPIAGVIQEHRKLSKLLHSTLASIIVWAKPPASSRVLDLKEKVDHVHHIFGRWLHTSTATGRLSMEEPNLQCVENKIYFSKGEDLQEDGNGDNNDKVEINARRLFVPTQEKWVILSADYSQIEVRLMAHFSEDPALIALLSRPSGDLFRMITAQWTGLSEANVTQKQREQTKRLVYGILYGMGVHALADQLECSVAEASLYLERFRSAFPGVNTWLQLACVNCRQRGYVITLGGRKRFLDKINNGTNAEKARAERQAVNSICQGSAADLIKMAMIKLHAAIAGQAVEGNQSTIKGRCRLLLQIHDELVLEVDKLFLKEVSSTLRSCMEGAASLKVPLRVKLQVGETWGSLDPLEDSKLETWPS